VYGTDRAVVFRMKCLSQSVTSDCDRHHCFYRGNVIMCLLFIQRGTNCNDFDASISITRAIGSGGP
jgi:hypothetical protein